MAEPKVPEVPQFLADQLTLCRPWRADYAQRIITDNPNFFTFRGSAIPHKDVVLNLK